MAEPVEIRFVEASRLALQSGDTVLLRVPGDFGDDGFEALTAQARDRFPDHPVVVLAAGLELEAVGLPDAVAMFVASRDALRAALGAADRSGVGRNEIARIAASAYSRATVLKMLAEDNGPSPVGAADGQLADVGGVRKQQVGGDWVEQS